MARAPAKDDLTAFGFGEWLGLQGIKGDVLLCKMAAQRQIGGGFSRQPAQGIQVEVTRPHPSNRQRTAGEKDACLGQVGGIRETHEV